jgi:hypothetical protein
MDIFIGIGAVIALAILGGGLLDFLGVFTRRHNPKD